MPGFLPGVFYIIPQGTENFGIYQGNNMLSIAFLPQTDGMIFRKAKEVFLFLFITFVKIHQSIRL